MTRRRTSRVGGGVPRDPRRGDPEAEGPAGGVRDGDRRQVTPDLRRARVRYRSMGDEGAGPRDGGRAPLGEGAPAPGDRPTGPAEGPAGSRVRGGRDDRDGGPRSSSCIEQLHRDGARWRMTDDLDRAAEVLREATTVALACHVNPDADALGSMLGLSSFLRATGVETMCSFPNEPFEPPRWASLLPGVRRASCRPTTSRRARRHGHVRLASMDRLGHARRRPPIAPGELIWIDHHVSNEGLGTIPLDRPDGVLDLRGGLAAARRIGGDDPRRHRGVPLRRPRHRHRASSSTRRSRRRRSGSPPRSASSPSTTPRLVQALYEDNSPARTCALLARRARPRDARPRGRPAVDLPHAGRPRLRGRARPARPTT